MTIDEAANAIRSARQQIILAEQAAQQVSNLLAGRLKALRVNDDTLTALKKELRDYNIHTREWKP